MFTTRFERWLPAAGIVFGTLLAIALYATSGEPRDNASVGAVYDYWSRHGGWSMWLDIFGLELAALAISLFGASIYIAIRLKETVATVYAPLAMAGAILAATGFTGTAIITASVARAAADKGAEPGIQTVTYTLEQLRSWDWLLWTPGMTVMLVAAGLGELRTRAMPPWLCWAAVTLGIAFFTPLGFVGLFALPFWMVVAGTALIWRRPTETTRMNAAVPARRA